MLSLLKDQSLKNKDTTHFINFHWKHATSNLSSALDMCSLCTYIPQQEEIEIVFNTWIREA